MKDITIDNAYVSIFANITADVFSSILTGENFKKRMRLFRRDYKKEINVITICS